MGIYKKVRAVQRLYRRVQKQSDAFRLASGLQCPPGCGACCRRPGVEATVLEFLPLAWNLCRARQTAYWLDTLARAEPGGVCALLSPDSGNPDGGTCSLYPWRGMICRLFAFAAEFDKYGHPKLTSCRVLRQREPERLDAARLAVPAGLPVPLMRHFATALYAIDPPLASRYLPINRAITQAIESIVFPRNLFERGSATG